jgi:diguanylate cyclase (GGDEF)-like protein
VEKEALTRILIVDDEEDIRLSLQELLIEHKFEAFVAENSKEALQILQKNEIDIIITDLVMPGGLNGIELTREIKELKPDVPVIIMTAYASIEYAVESIKAGAADFITKPFKFKHTLFTIKKTLETKKLRELASKSKYYENLSNIDELTGIYNHRCFNQMLKSEIKKHSIHKLPLNLLIADLDNFKNINDTYGHLTGDLVLKTIAEILKRSTRNLDFVSRYGGEEFAIILPETSRDEAIRVGERIVHNVETTHFKNVEGKPIGKLTITIGMASYPKDAKTLHHLIDKSDQALYEGKKTGKNKICIFRKTK